MRCKEKCEHAWTRYPEQKRHSSSQWSVSRYLGCLAARKLSQLQDNLASFNLTLSADQLKTLDEASRIELGFPYDIYAKEMARAIAYGGMRDQIMA